MFYPFSRSFLWSVLGCFCAGEDPETGRGRGKRLRSRSHFPILTTSTRFSQSFVRSEAGFSVISVKAYETLHNVVEFLMRPWDWFVFVFSDMLKFLMSNFPKFWPWKHAGLTVFGGNIMRLVHMLPHSCLFQKGLSMELRSIFIAQLLFLSILGWKLFFFLSDLDSFSQFHFSPYPFCTMSESPCPCQFIAIYFLFLYAYGNLSLLVFSLHETIGEGSVTRLQTDEISLLDTGNRLPTQPRANSASPPSPELSC